MKMFDKFCPKINKMCIGRKCVCCVYHPEVKKGKYYRRMGSSSMSSTIYDDEPAYYKCVLFKVKLCEEVSKK